MQGVQEQEFKLLYAKPVQIYLFCVNYKTVE